MESQKKQTKNFLNPDMVTSRGSLGLLALGIAGLKVWREKRKEEQIREVKKS
ncbi:MAG TPA: hypothetical protein VNW99_12800 [Cytophagaceae bacterium]|jgi:hypothetical protein|nr:hypothetical protein [Cytophagaceae bacterium]